MSIRILHGRVFVMLQRCFIFFNYGDLDCIFPLIILVLDCIFALLILVLYKIMHFEYLFEYRLIKTILTDTHNV